MMLWTIGEPLNCELKSPEITCDKSACNAAVDAGVVVDGLRIAKSPFIDVKASWASAVTTD